MAITTNKKLILQSIITIAVLVIIIPKIEWDQCYDMLLSVDPIVFGMLVILVVIDRLLMAIKWNVLLKVKNIQLSSLQSLKLYVIGGFWGEILPTGIGVDVYRVQALAKRGNSIKDTTSSIVVERVVGFFATISFAFVSMSVVACFFEKSLMVYVVPLFCVFVIPIAFVLILLKTSLLFNISKIFRRFEDHVIYKKIKSLYKAIIDYKTNPVEMWVFYFLSVLEQASAPIFVYIGGFALGIHLGFIYLLAIVPTMFILLRIPISIQGIGVEEGLFIFFLSLIGVSTTEAFALAFIIRMARWTLSLCGGLIYISEKTNIFIREYTHG